MVKLFELFEHSNETMPRQPISIEVLETLDAIERRGSFARAAEELNKATSAVSYTIQKLEEQLDVTIFQRQGRRSVLTPAGKLLLNEGREILRATTRLADKTREVATGWEPRIRIAIETLYPLEPVFSAIKDFLDSHPTVEIDISETVLNGGWEALELDDVDLLVGAPGPAPRQKGYRLVPLNSPDLVPVIARNHPLCKAATGNEAETVMSQLRTVVTHDTSQTEITRSAGISSDGKQFYVQNAEQKFEAIKAGIGVGHLPKKWIVADLKKGNLKQLNIDSTEDPGFFMAWKLSNKGKGLRSLTATLSKLLTS